MATLVATQWNPVPSLSVACPTLRSPYHTLGCPLLHLVCRYRIGDIGVPLWPGFRVLLLNLYLCGFAFRLSIVAFEPQPADTGDPNLVALDLHLISHRKAVRRVMP